MTGTIVRERPIVMDAAEVRAILDGRKTQFRRVIRPQPEGHFVFMPLSTELVGCGKVEKGWQRCPYGVPGDRLYVQETWCLGTGNGKTFGLNVQYRTEPWCIEVPAEHYAEALVLSNRIGFGRWRSSVHMPRWASRFDLEITAVQLERIKDISLNDIPREGVPCPYATPLSLRDAARLRADFARHWDSRHARRGLGWEVDPWVWVVTFRRINPTPARIGEGGAP